MNTSSIGKRIRKYREAKGWRQEDFAERIGLSVTYTGMIERGEKVPKLETFITIANALEVSADLLLADVLSTGYTKAYCKATATSIITTRMQTQVRT